MRDCSFDEFIAEFPRAFRGIIKLRNEREEHQIDLRKKRPPGEHLRLMMLACSHILEAEERAK